MDDESYANIVFANSPEKNPKVQEQREDTVYAEVKTADISSQPISTEERICNPCQNGWKNYMSSCYKFQMTDFPWTTWNKGKTNCSQLGAHLVIIDTKEEQEYINNHTRYYYDDFHGYWFGLSKSHAGKWHWVNGSELNGGNWKDNRDDGNCAMTMPSSDPSRSWAAKNCAMENRWICETEALHWPQG
uniref:C-type lectin domain-containing protein n=1 Tax=Denticeps clupeoides TaxID=299321 RepID=A0AAY4DR98_9TELE